MFPSLSQETIQGLIQESQQKVGKERVKDFSNPFTAPFQGEVSQYDPKLYTENVLSNLEDYRARQQSTADALVNTVTKNLGKFALRAVDNIGFPVWAAIGVAQQGDASGLYNNPVSSLIRDMESGLDEALPNYMTKEQQDSVLSKFGSIAGLNSILDGLSYTGAAIVGGLGTSKLLQIGSKGLGRIAKNLALSDDLAETVVNALNTNKVDDLINLMKPGFITHEGKGLLKSFGASAYGATVEAAAEASETYKTISEDWYQKIMQEKGVVTDEDRKLIHEQAKQGANVNFGVNMAVISGSRFMQLNKLFRNQTDDFKRVAGVVRGETGEFTKEVGKLNKYKKFFDVGANTLEEAGEELSQSYSNSFLTSYYSADDSKYKNVMGAMADAYDSVIGKEGQESGLVGGAVGLISSLLTGGLKTRKRENDREQEAISIANSTKLNPALKTLAESTARTFRLDDLQEKAAQEGDLFTYENLKNAKLFDVVKSRLDIDAYDDLVADIKGDAKLTQEEFETKYELKSGSVDKDAFVSELLQKTEKIKNGYGDTVKRFGTSVNPMTLQTIALTGSVIENAKEREAKVKTELMKEGFDYDAFIAKKSKSNSGLRYLLDQRIKQEQIVKDLQSQHRKAVKENNVALAAELSAKISDEWQKQLSLDTEINEGVNDLPEGKSFSFIGATEAEINKFKNTLAENEDRVGDVNITEKDLKGLPITNRRKVEYLAKDLKNLQQMQAEFGYAYNDLVTKGDSSKTIQTLLKTVGESDGAKLLKDTFTITGSKQVYNPETKENEFQKTEAYVDKGLYSYEKSRWEAPKVAGEKGKTILGEKRYVLEVKDRRVTNGIPEVLVSEDGEKAEWKKLGYLNRLGVTKINNENLKPEEAFYYKYKDRLITAWIPDLYHNGKQTHSAGIVTGFMAFDSYGRLTLNVWNEKTEMWDSVFGTQFKDSNGFHSVGASIFKVDGEYTNIYEDGKLVKSPYSHVRKYLKISTLKEAESLLIATSQIELKRLIEKKIAALNEGAGKGVKSPSLDLLNAKRKDLEAKIKSYLESFDATKLSSFSILDDVLEWKKELDSITDDIEFRNALISLYGEELNSTPFEPKTLSDFDAEFAARKTAIIENQGYKYWLNKVKTWRDVERANYDEAKAGISQITELVDKLTTAINEIVHDNPKDYQTLEELSRKRKNKTLILEKAVQAKEITDAALEIRKEISLYIRVASELKRLENLELAASVGASIGAIDSKEALIWDLMLNQRAAIDSMIKYAMGNAFDRAITKNAVNVNNNYDEVYTSDNTEDVKGDILPLYDHNGRLPFRKTTGMSNKANDTSGTGKSKLIFEKWLNSPDIEDSEVKASLLRVVTLNNLAEINKELVALGIKPIEINYTSTNIVDAPIYVIVTDEFGEIRRFDANGSKKEKGVYAAVSVLSSLEEKTASGENKFRDLAEQEAGKIKEDKANEAKDRTEWLNSTEPVYLPINDRTFGVAKFDDGERASKSVKQALGDDLYDKLLDPNSKVKLIVEKKDGELDGKPVKGVQAGRVYYTDASGRFIALNSRKLNKDEVDTVYYGIVRALEDPSDYTNIIKKLKTLVRWGFITKPVEGKTTEKRVEKAYALYRNSDGLSLSYGYGEVLDTITLEELAQEGEKSEEFRTFLSGLPLQISAYKIKNAQPVNFNKVSYNRKGSEGFKSFKKGYVQFLLDDVLTTRLRPNNPQLNDTQFENSYVRVGNQTQPKVKVVKVVQEEAVAEVDEEALSAFGTGVDVNIDDFDLDSAIAGGTGGMPKKSSTPVTNDLGGDVNFAFVAGVESANNSTPPVVDTTTDGNKKKQKPGGSAESLKTDKNKDDPSLGDREVLYAEAVMQKYGFTADEAELVEGLIDDKSFGRFWNSANKLQSGIVVSDEAAVFTSYHEEFHLVEKLYLSDVKRVELYKEWFKAQGKPVERLTPALAMEASEGLAEEYRYYVIQKRHKHLGGIKEFIKGLYEFIQKVLKMKLTSDSNPVIKKMFNDIYSGAYANTKRGTVESRELINKSLTTVLFKTLNGKYKFKEEPPKANVLRYISDADYRKQVESDWVKYYEKYGIKSFSDVLKLHIKISGGKENPVIVNNNEIKEFYSYLNPDRVEKEDEEDENVRGVKAAEYERQDVVDPRNSLSGKVKLLLKSIPTIGEKGELVTNKLGLSYHTDTDVLLNDLFSAMRNVATEEEVVSILRDSKDLRFKELYKVLQYDKPVVLSELLVQNEFLQFFAKSYAEYDSYYASPEGVKFVQMNQVARHTALVQEVNANFKKLGGTADKIEAVLGEFRLGKTTPQRDIELVKELGFGVFNDITNAGQLLSYLKDDYPKYKDKLKVVEKISSTMKEIFEKELQFRGTADSFILTTSDGRNKYVIHKHSFLTKTIKKLKEKFKDLRLNISNSYSMDGEDGETENSDLAFDDGFVLRLNQLVKGRLPYIFSGSKSLQYEISGIPAGIVSTGNDVEDYIAVIRDHFLELHDLHLKNTDGYYLPAETKSFLKSGGGFKVFKWLKNTKIGRGNLLDELVTAAQSTGRANVEFNKYVNSGVLKKAIETHLDEKTKEIQKELELRGYNVVDGYMKVVEEDEELSNKELFRKAVVFSELGNYWQTKNITGSSFLYNDPLKRFPAIQSGKDNFNVSKRVLDWIEENSPGQTTKFGSSVNVLVVDDMELGNSKFTDAQGIVSPEFFRLQSIAEGQWSQKHEDLYNKLMLGYEPEGDIIFGARKPQFYGEQDTFNEGDNVPVSFFKMSTYPLFPYLTEQFEDLKQIANAMKVADVHILTFHSAVKVGRKVGFEGTLSLKDFVTNPESAVDLIQRLDLNNYGTQTAVSEEAGSVQLEASQIRKIIKGDLIGLKGEKTLRGDTYQELLNELDNLTYEKIKLSDAKLLEELGIQEYVEADAVKFKFKSIKVIREKLLREAKGKGYPQNIVNGINTLLSENKGLDTVIGRDRIESLLLSLVKNSSIKLKRHGDTSVQTSPVGFVSFTKDSISQSEELGWYRNENGEITAMEVYLPDYLKGSIDPEKATPEQIEKLLTFVGFRIPTQALASIDKIRVKGFVAGNMIVVPKQHPGKTGGDFDVDKLNLYFPEVYFVKGKPVYIEYADGEKFDAVYNKYVSSLGEGVQPMSMRDFRIKAINNRILEDYKLILSDPRNEDKLLTGIDDAEIKGIVDGIRVLENSGMEEDILDMFYLLKKGISHQAGKSILGMIALHNTHHVESQLAGLRFNEQVSKDIENKFPIKLGEMGALDLVKDLSGKKNVSASIDQYVSAAVDVEKDDYIIDLNFTKELTGLGMLIIRLGVPLQEANLLMAQPVMKEYTRLHNLYSSITWQAFNGKLSASDVRKRVIREIEAKLPTASGQVNSNTLAKEISNKEIYTSVQSRVWSSLMQGDTSLFNLAQTLNNFMQVTKYDTQGNAKSFAENELIKRKADSFEESDNFLKTDETKRNPVLVNTQRFFERDGTDTFLKGFKGVVDRANGYFASLFELESGRYNDLLKPILNQVYSAYASSSDIVRTANIVKRDFISYVVQNNDLLGEKQGLMFGDKSVPVRLAAAKGINKLTDSIIVNEKDGTIYLADSSRMDTIKTNSYNEAFEELWEIDPQLGEDFVKFILFQNGFKRSPLTLMDIVPNKILNDVIKKFYMENTMTVGDMNDFALKLAANNPRNSILVPYKSFDDFSYREGFSKSKKGAGYVLNHKAGKVLTKYELDGRNGSDYVTPVFPVKEEGISVENPPQPPVSNEYQLDCKTPAPKA